MPEWQEKLAISALIEIALFVRCTSRGTNQPITRESTADRANAAAANLEQDAASCEEGTGSRVRTTATRIP